MAAGVGNSAAARDGCALVSGQLRETVGPAVSSAVCRGSVNDANVRIVDQRDRFSRAGVGQAQENNVRRVQEFAPLFVVVALVLVDPHQLEILPRSDPVKNLKACSTGLAVDVYLCLTHSEVPRFFEFRC